MYMPVAIVLVLFSLCVFVYKKARTSPRLERSNDVDVQLERSNFQLERRNDQLERHRFILHSSENSAILHIDLKNVVSFEIEQCVFFNSEYYFKKNTVVITLFEDENEVATFKSDIEQGNFPLLSVLNNMNTQLLAQNCPFSFSIDTLSLVTTLELQIRSIPDGSGGVISNLGSANLYSVDFGTVHFAKKMGFNARLFEKIDVPVSVDQGTVISSAFLKSSDLPNVSGSSHVKVLTNNTKFKHSSQIVGVFALTQEKNFYRKTFESARIFDPTTVDFVKVVLLDDKNEYYETNGLPYTIIFDVRTVEVDQIKKIFR